MYLDTSAASLFCVLGGGAISSACASHWYEPITNISPGLATLTGAIVGFSALAMQSFFSLRSLSKSHAHQAMLDRERRQEEHAAELRREVRLRQEATRVLANSLSGELSTAYSRVQNALGLMKIAAQAHSGTSVMIHNFKMEQFLPHLTPSIYLANIHNLGLLGPSTAGEVIEVYQGLQLKEIAASDLQSQFVAMLISGWVATYETWLQDVEHVNLRLLSQTSSTVEDPGPLYQARLNRKKSVLDQNA